MKVKREFLRKTSILLAVVVLLTTMIPTNAFATETYGPGDYYLGHFTFTDTNAGSRRTLNANYMKLKIAWKKGEWYCSQNIDLDVNVERIWNGEKPFDHTFRITEDANGKDADGYYYVETDWFKINNTSDYRINYEAFTAQGETPPGYNRSGDVHTWIELKQ